MVADVKDAKLSSDIWAVWAASAIVTANAKLFQLLLGRVQSWPQPHTLHQTWSNFLQDGCPCVLNAHAGLLKPCKMIGAVERIENSRVAPDCYFFVFISEIPHIGGFITPRYILVFATFVSFLVLFCFANPSESKFTWEAVAGKKNALQPQLNIAHEGLEEKRRKSHWCK